MFVETFQDEQIDAFFRFLLKLNAVSQTSHVFAVFDAKHWFGIGLMKQTERCSTPLQFEQTIASKELTTLRPKGF